MKVDNFKDFLDLLLPNTKVRIWRRETWRFVTSFYDEREMLFIFKKWNRHRKWWDYKVFDMLEEMYNDKIIELV